MVLRQLELEDAPYMLEWMHDPVIQRSFQRNMAASTLETVTGFIQSARADFPHGSSLHFAITEDGGEYLGTISLKGIDPVSKNAEYAIVLRAAAQGKGLGRQATYAVLDYAFSRLGLERVYLNVLADNTAAIRVYESCGFVCEGTFRKALFLNGEYKDLRWYSVLKEEYGR